MASRFTELVVDSAEPEKLAEFWAEVLGYRVTERERDSAFIEGTEDAAPGIVFVRVPEPKTVKNRVHIDVNPIDRDQDEEVERILALGARRADVGQGEQRWVVLADPEGNEFCVLRTRLG
jgi:predicted enzyme related to lactoylglutathione lyase